jgi:pimeloyl-ACP methyl ester carboxylesterase
MFYKSYGNGEQLYLAFHGWAGDHREFSAIAARIPVNATWISVDLPGYGASTAPESWQITSLIDQMDRELDAVFSRFKDITLVGFCSGIVLGVLLARKRQDCFSRIVMIDPFAFVPWYFKIFTWGEFGRRAYASTFMSPAGRKITDRILSSMQTSDADFTAAFADADHALIQRYLRLYAQLDGTRVFSRFEIEVDIALGEKTFGAVRKSVRLIRTQWPEAQVHELARTGHLPLVKGARALRRIIFSIS